MTFDDFKKQFEIFNHIDTAEKLAACEKQYQQRLLYLKDQDHFEPLLTTFGQDTPDTYQEHLYQLFSLYAIEENSFGFLVMPSFEPEYLLVVKKVENGYSVTHTILVKQYWADFYNSDKSDNPEKKTCEYQLNKEIGEALSVLVDKTIGEAKKTETGRIVLDGIVYHLLKRVNNNLLIVTKHSPDPNSKSGKVVEIMEQLIKEINYPGGDRNHDILFQILTQI